MPTKEMSPSAFKAPKDAPSPLPPEQAAPADSRADPNILQEKMIAQALAKVADSRLSSLIGQSIMILCAIGAVLAWKWDGHTYDRRGCTTLQSIDGHIFKVDSCEGTWERIGLPPLSEEVQPPFKKSKES